MSEIIVKELAYKLKYEHPKRLHMHVPLGIIRIGELLPKVFETSPELIPCVKGYSATVYPADQKENVIFEIKYSEILPGTVEVIAQVGDTIKALFHAVSLHRKKMIIVYKKSIRDKVISETQSILKEPEFLNRYVNSVHIKSYSGSGYDFEYSEVILKYSVSYKEMRKYEKHMEQQISHISAICKAQGPQDWKKVYAMMQYCVKHWRYSDQVVAPGFQYTAYAALVCQKAVCMGISLAICEICKHMGIPCRYVAGRRNGEGHAWNCVFVCGGWFYIDVTDAIVTHRILDFWGMVKLDDRVLDEPEKEVLTCNCDKKFLRSRGVLNGNSSFI